MSGDREGVRLSLQARECLPERSSEQSCFGLHPSRKIWGGLCNEAVWARPCDEVKRSGRGTMLKRSEAGTMMSTPQAGPTDSPPAHSRQPLCRCHARAFTTSGCSHVTAVHPEVPWEHAYTPALRWRKPSALIASPSSAELSDRPLIRAGGLTLG